MPNLSGKTERFDPLVFNERPLLREKTLKILKAL
jgi:hypothetical protein